MPADPEKTTPAPAEGGEGNDPEKATPLPPEAGEEEGSKDQDGTVPKTQHISLQKRHEVALGRITQLEQAGMDTAGLKSVLTEIKTGIESQRDEQTELRIQTLIASGDEEAARAIAEREMKRGVTQLGLDLKTDPRLQRLRDAEDPVEAHKVWSLYLKPVLSVEAQTPDPVVPKPDPANPSKQETPEEMEARIRADERAKGKKEREEKGLHKISSQIPSGGKSLDDMSPQEQIRVGLEQRSQA